MSNYIYTYSRFKKNIKSEKKVFGVSRNSRFAGIETKTRKVVNCSDDLRNEIIRAKKEENRRETIMALAKAM